MIPMPGLDQQLNPAFSPDGRTVAFRAIQNGRSDIFSYNLDTKAITNLTKDDAYDFAPTFSPDGQWIYYSSVQGTQGEDLPHPAGRGGLARADHLRRLERRGRLSLARRQDALLRLRPRRRHLQHLSRSTSRTARPSIYTNVVGGCFSPTVLIGRDGTERLVFSAYYKRRFTLYVTDAKKPYHRSSPELNPAPSPAGPTTIPPYQPSIEVSIDPEKIDKKPSRKLSSRTPRSWSASAPTRHSCRTRS